MLWRIIEPDDSFVGRFELVAIIAKLARGVIAAGIEFGVGVSTFVFSGVTVFLREG